MVNSSVKTHINSGVAISAIEFLEALDAREFYMKEGSPHEKQWIRDHEISRLSDVLTRVKLGLREDAVLSTGQQKFVRDSIFPLISSLPLNGGDPAYCRAQLVAVELVNLINGMQSKGA